MSYADGMVFVAVFVAVLEYRFPFDLEVTRLLVWDLCTRGFVDCTRQTVCLTHVFDRAVITVVRSRTAHHAATAEWTVWSTPVANCSVYATFFSLPAPAMQSNLQQVHDISSGFLFDCLICKVMTRRSEPGSDQTWINRLLVALPGPNWLFG